jgi:uncharacterized membrane protein
MRLTGRAIAPAALFILAGAAHFARPEIYRPIVPPLFGDAGAVVALSGAAEIAGGAGLLLPGTRRAAGWGLMVLLLAVWPANWYMALNAERFAGVAPAWMLWLRVPLQVPLLWWIAYASRPGKG